MGNYLLHWRRCGSTEANRGHKSTSTSVLHFTNVPVARDCLANKGLIVRKPSSGSARHRWARENSKHRRTATRQRGFCSSSLKQGPPDLSKTGVTPENGRLEIVRKAASLRAPTQSTELPKFRVCSPFCQCQGARLQPTISVERGDVDVARRNDEHKKSRDVGERIDFVAAADAQSTPSGEKKGHVGAERRGNFEQFRQRQLAAGQVQVAKQSGCCVA